MANPTTRPSITGRQKSNTPSPTDPDYLAHLIHHYPDPNLVVVDDAEFLDLSAYHYSDELAVAAAEWEFHTAALTADFPELAPSVSITTTAAPAAAGAAAVAGPATPARRSRPSTRGSEPGQSPATRKRKRLSLTVNTIISPSTPNTRFFASPLPIDPNASPNPVDAFGHPIPQQPQTPANASARPDSASSFGSLFHFDDPLAGNSFLREESPFSSSNPLIALPQYGIAVPTAVPEERVAEEEAEAERQGGEAGEEGKAAMARSEKTAEKTQVERTQAERAQQGPVLALPTLDQDWRPPEPQKEDDQRQAEGQALQSVEQPTPSVGVQQHQQHQQQSQQNQRQNQRQNQQRQQQPQRHEQNQQPQQPQHHQSQTTQHATQHAPQHTIQQTAHHSAPLAYPTQHYPPPPGTHNLLRNPSFAYPYEERIIPPFYWPDTPPPGPHNAYPLYAPNNDPHYRLYEQPWTYYRGAQQPQQVPIDPLQSYGLHAGFYPGVYPPASGQYHNPPALHPSAVPIAPQSQNQALPAAPAAATRHSQRKRPREENPNAAVYFPLALPLPAWGPNNTPLFNYTPEGEWSAQFRLGPDELEHYIANLGTQGRGLAIWLQHPPAQYSHRYPHPWSSKCRARDCPATNNTILKGFWRVCFDEFPTETGGTRDPFHNAGYMHLFCLEEMLDASSLEMFGLEPDLRSLERVNPMKMTRDTDKVRVAYDRWMAPHRQQQQQQQQQGGRPRIRRATPGAPETSRLWYVLTEMHTRKQPPSRVRMRNKRDGNSIDKHMGNAARYYAAERELKQARIQLRRKGQTDGGNEVIVIDDDDDAE